MSLRPIKPFPTPPSPPAPPGPPGPGDKPVQYAVKQWSYMMYGGAGPLRVQVALYRMEQGGIATAAFARFYDEGAPFPADKVEDGIISMNAPIAALAGVLEMLAKTTGALSVSHVGGKTMFDYTPFASN